MSSLMNDPDFLRSFDGLKSRTVFCLWTGDELMSENRLKALWTIFRNTGCQVAFITRDTIGHWVHPDHPLHPAFQDLSSTHKSDYLRCYLMYHYGGGYTDIKQTTKAWGRFFTALEASPHWALGYTELAHGIPHLTGERGDTIRAAHRELIGLCAFIFRKHSPLASAWFAQANALLDAKREALSREPGKFALDQTGLVLPDGTASAYPLRWAELLGEILHPLFYEHRERLLKTDIEPVFHGYR